MKKLKKFLLFIACCLTACAIAIPFAACAEDPDDGGDGGNDGTEQGGGDNTGEETQSGTNVLQWLRVDELGAKRQFNIGESFSSEGLTVTAMITNLGGTGGSQNPDVTDKAVIDSSAFDSSKPGTYPIYISYTFGGITLYASYNVTVVSAIEGTIAGLEIGYEGDEQAVLSSENTSASVNLQGLEVTRISGEDANNTTQTPVTDYKLSYSKDGGELVDIAAGTTTLTGLTKGTYSIYATADYTSGGETFTMSGFFMFYVIDPVASIKWNEDGETDFAYGYTPGEAEDGTVLPEVGVDWTYTVTYASGVTKTVGYKGVTVEGVDTGNSSANAVTKTATVNYSESYPQINDSGVLVTTTDSASCTVDYTVAGNPNAGQTVTDNYGLNFSDDEWNEAPYTNNDGGMGFNDPVAVGADGKPTTAGGIISMYGKDGTGTNFSVRATGNSAATAAGYTSEFNMGAIEVSSHIARRGIQIDLSEYDSATITVIWRASSGRGISLFTDEAVATAADTSSLRKAGYMNSENSAADNVLNTTEFTNVEGGDIYYLGGNNNTVYLYEITVAAEKIGTMPEETYSVDFSASAWSDAVYASGGSGMPFGDPVSIGLDGNPTTAGGIMYMYGKASNSNFYIRDASSSAQAAGYTNELYAGAIELSSGTVRRAIQIDLSDFENATITIVWRADNGRGISLYTDEVCASAADSSALRPLGYMKSENATSLDNMMSTEFANVAGGDIYYLGGNNNTVYIYEITVVAQPAAAE